MTISLFSIALVLFLTMDPVGNVSTFLKVLEPFGRRRYHLIVFREMLIVLVTMFIFTFLGEYVFTILQISETTVRLSSGVILFVIALTIIFPGSRDIRPNLPKLEPFIIPLAIPTIAGPALVATVMLYSHLVPEMTVMVSAVVLAWIAGLLVLLFAPQIKRVLGNNGLLACEKLMGMVLILMAVQRFMDGIHSFLTQYHG